ncbi:MAG TPA: PAS domain-containing protein, partial [Polyangiaceae bacterium]|nr:PAS domain-containing protein [Polyangiaceae bacterium]
MDWEEMKLSFPGVVPDELLWPLLACLPDHVLWLDTECRVLGSNKSLNPAQSRPLLGRCVLDLLDPLERAKAESAYDEVRTTGKPNSFQARYNDPSGQSSLFETFIVPLGAPGDISGFITNSRDVTGASQRDRNLELAVQATGMGIWRFDVRTGAVEWNAEMHRIMGREVPIAPDTYLAEAVHPEDKEQAVAQTRRSFEEGVFGTISHRIVRPDGAVRWVMLVGNMERGAGGALIAAHGVTID